MDRLTSGYRNAAQNFAKLLTMEKQRATKALEFARANGAGNLSDEQKQAFRSVRTEEAMRQKARRFKLEKTFGSKQDSEMAGIEQTQKNLKS